MRPAFLAAAMVTALTLVAPTPGQAQTYPWCAQYGGMGGGGGRNCGFVSHAQCMATVHGMGGFCERNLFYTGPRTAHAPVQETSAGLLIPFYSSGIAVAVPRRERAL